MVADRLLLTASTVVGGGWILGGDVLCSALISCINSTTRLPVDDLESMTACLLDIAGLNVTKKQEE